jgi:hypothetical protein
VARLPAGHWPVYHAARARTGARCSDNRKPRPRAVVNLESKTMAYTLKRSINGLTHDDIKRIYDQNPNMTLKELSNLTGFAVPYLKKLLLEG